MRFSVISARNIVEAMDKRKYEIVSIGIDKQGRWFFDEGRGFSITASKRRLSFSAAESHRRTARSHTNTYAYAASGLGEVDVVFPVLHGPFGEDGTVQGLLKLANVPFCRRRSPRFRGGHGQGRHETVAPRRQDTDRQIPGF